MPCKAWEIAAVGFGGEEQLHQGPMAAAHHPLEWETTSNGSGCSNGQSNYGRRGNCSNG
ncbi:unnamed protein product [Closterium sp. NIES-54]